MDLWADPVLMARLVQYFRLVAGDISQEALAARSGLSLSSIWRYESEDDPTMPPPDTLARLAGSVGLTMPFVHAYVVPVLAASLAAARTRIDGDVERAAAALEVVLAGPVQTTIVALRESFQTSAHRPWVWRGAPRPEDRLWAEDACGRLMRRTPEQRRYLIETFPEFQTWAVAARLAELSEAEAADEAGAALELAERAVWVAERAFMDDLWRSRTLGYCLAFLANAQRVGGRLRPADETFARAATLWVEGAPADPGGLLPEWRLPDRLASLRREQRRFAEALDLLARARSAAPKDAEGRILLNEGYTLQRMGDTNRAVETLRRAAPLLEAQGDARQLFGARFNLAGCLCDLEQYAEAEALLPQVRASAEARGKKLDLVRVRWLHGTVDAGLGRGAEALQAFEEVKRAFIADEIAYDAALVSLDLALLLLPKGRTAEVRELAEEMMWIFDAEGVPENALAALRVFCEAARQEAATVELAQRVHRFLERAREDPERRFEP